MTGSVDAERLPIHPRALELFRTGHYDLASARLIAADEWRLQQSRQESLVPIAITERPSRPPIGRLVGFERGTATESTGTP